MGGYRTLFYVWPDMHLAGHSFIEINLKKYYKIRLKHTGETNKIVLKGRNYI